MLNTLGAVSAMRVRSADLAVDDPDLRRDLMAAFERVLDHGMLMHGPEVEEFERRFAIACAMPIPPAGAPKQGISIVSLHASSLLLTCALPLTYLLSVRGWIDDQHGRVLRNKIVLRHSFDLPRSDLQILFELAVHQIGILSNDRSRGQGHSFLFIRIAAENESGNLLVFGLVEFS